MRAIVLGIGLAGAAGVGILLAVPVTRETEIVADTSPQTIVVRPNQVQDDKTSPKPFSTGTHPVLQKVILPSDEMVSGGDEPADLLTRRSMPPSQLADFFDLTENEQLQRITDLQDDSRLPEAVILFLVDLIGDQRIQETTRNNVVNCLYSQDVVRGDLHRKFSRLIDSDQFSETDRTYAVQYLARSLKFAPDPERRAVLAELGSLTAHPIDTIASTAILVLNRVPDRDEGAARIIIDQRVAEVLSRQSAQPLTTMAALTMVAEKRLTSQISAVRKLCDHRDSSVRRTALAALGNIGSPQDLVLLAKYESDEGPGVSLAATSAQERLRKNSALDHDVQTDQQP